MARTVEADYSQVVTISTSHDDGRIGEGRLGLRIPEATYFTMMTRAQALRLASALMETVAELDTSLQ